MPLMTSTSTPVSASMRSTSSLPLAAVRIALVALAMTSLAPERVGELAQAPDGRDRAVGRGRRDAAVAGDVVAEAQHLLLPGDRRERAVEVHVGDEEVEGVRSEVERGDAHRTGRYPRVPWPDHPCEPEEIGVEGNRNNGH